MDVWTAAFAIFTSAMSSGTRSGLTTGRTQPVRAARRQRVLVPLEVAQAASQARQRTLAAASWTLSKCFASICDTSIDQTR
jgi:hypothetical protein